MKAIHARTVNNPLRENPQEEAGASKKENLDRVDEQGKKGCRGRASGWNALRGKRVANEREAKGNGREFPSG